MKAMRCKHKWKQWDTHKWMQTRMKANDNESNEIQTITNEMGCKHEWKQRDANMNESNVIHTQMNAMRYTHE